jgi:PhnB protein
LGGPESQTVNSKYVPLGWPVVIPRIAVDDPEALVASIQHVFGAVDRFRPERPSELQIGDSIVMVGSTVDRRAMPAFLYVYVEDTDRVFQRALDRGAKSLERIP